MAAKIITPELLSALMTSFRADFQKGLTGAPSQYSKIATVIPSNSRSNTYGWLGKFPKFRKWVGDRVISQMAAHGYQIENEKLESTVGVDRVDIEDDTLGIYAPLFEELGLAAGEVYDSLTFSALSQGFNLPCYDGQNFFDTDHPVYPNVDGTGTATSVANTYHNAAYTGDPWYVLDCSRAIKPIIYQERIKPELEAVTDPKNAHVFIKDEYLYGGRIRGAAGYGFWQMAYAMRDTLNSDNLWKVIKAMRLVTSDGDKKLGIRPTTLVVPPSLEDVATKLLEREFTSENGVTVDNELQGRLELVVGDYL